VLAPGSSSGAAGVGVRRGGGAQQLQPPAGGTARPQGLLEAVRVGSFEIDAAIQSYVRREYGIAIGERTAEEIKLAIGSAAATDDEYKAEVRGRDLMSGLPKGEPKRFRDFIDPPPMNAVFAITGGSRLADKRAARYGRYGLEVNAEQITTSGTLLQDYFAKHRLRGARCAVLGPADSRRYVERAGGEVVPPGGRISFRLGLPYHGSSGRSHHTEAAFRNLLRSSAEGLGVLSHLFPKTF